MNYEDIYIDPSQEIPYNLTNPFDRFPLDVLQWEISPFLKPLERAAFNQVLSPQERIYKRFPDDYALMHHLRALNTEHNRIAKCLNTAIHFERDFEEMIIASRFLKFMTRPPSLVAFKYIKGFKESFLNVSVATFEDIEPSENGIEREKLVVRARKARRIVEAVPFERNIRLIEFKSIY